MIGHCIPAAGMAGLIKAALALHYRALPPTLCDSPRHRFVAGDDAALPQYRAAALDRPRGTKRRAGVNAFGFGGINAHVILEEAPEPDRAPRPAHLPAELIVVAAENPAGLSEKIGRLQAALAGPLAEAPLSAIAAASVSRDAAAGPARLAVVAADIADLADKLGKARDRLAEGRTAFQVRSGILCRRPSRRGQARLRLPGGGRAVPGHAGGPRHRLSRSPPMVRLLGRALRRGAPVPSLRLRVSAADHARPETKKQPRTRAVRPRNGVGNRCSSAARRCWRWCGASGWRPMPSSATAAASTPHLRAAGVLGGEGWEALEDQIRELNRLYKSMEAAGGVPTGALLTVGAVPREKALALADGEAVHLALDNCRQQTVLYGPRPRLEEIARELGGEGGLCAFLPFDRPYHTPLFAPIAEMVAGVYRDLRFSPPKVPLYSCATAAPMPTDPDQIRRLAADQWQSRVRFTETIERMYADGFRTFVEVGPSANLTGFIDNVLQGRDFLAVALDSRRRSSLVQLLHSVGRLWVSGHSLDLAGLIADRPIAAVDLDGGAAGKTKGRVFSNVLPFVRLPEDEIAALRESLRPQAAMTPPPPSPSVAEQPPQQAGDGGYTAPEVVSLPMNGGYAEEAPAAGSVVSGHFALMQRFLDLQNSVMTAALSGPLPPPQAYPFLHRIVTRDEDSLVAECDLDVNRDEFLRNHVLYAAKVSDLDPALTALPVVPLAVSIEMMAEAAAALAGGLVPVRLEKVRAFNWVALDSGRCTLRLEARRLSADSGEERMAVSLLDERGAPALAGEVVLAEAAPGRARPPGAAARRAPPAGMERRRTLHDRHVPRPVVSFNRRVAGVGRRRARCDPRGYAARWVFRPWRDAGAAGQSGPAGCDRARHGLLDRPASRHRFQLVPLLDRSHRSLPGGARGYRRRRSRRPAPLRER